MTPCYTLLVPIWTHLAQSGSLFHLFAWLLGLIWQVLTPGWARPADTTQAQKDSAKICGVWRTHGHFLWFLEGFLENLVPCTRLRLKNDQQNTIFFTITCGATYLQSSTNLKTDWSPLNKFNLINSKNWINYFSEKVLGTPTTLKGAPKTFSEK